MNSCSGVISSEVFAMPIVYEPLESVLKKTQSAIVAEVKDVGAAQEDRFHRTIEFDAILVEYIFGELPMHEELRFIYSEGRPHVREEMRVSPLMSGSGLEFQLNRGDKVIVLIGSENNISTSLNVLRVEPYKSLTALERYRRKQ